MIRKSLTLFLAIVLIAGALPISAYAALPEGVPGTLECAALEKIEVKNDESGIPYFQLEVKYPQSFLDLYTDRPTDGTPWMELYWKIDNGSWEMVYSGGVDGLLNEGNAVPGKVNTYYDILNPNDEGNHEAIVIKSHTYTIKAQLFYKYYYGEDLSESDFVSSPFSNDISIGSGSFYQKASEWSKPELQRASDLGLIPDILIGADMTKPITREEFCELAVLLYEKVKETQSEPESPNPFNDTTNLQILKAYKLRITAGTSTTTFSPKVLINREQCASMLFRTIKAIKPDGNFSIAGVKDFPDQKFISSWAVESSKYMSKLGIITGDKQGNFMPKATTPAQVAAGYGMATREQAIALTVRTFDKVPDIINVSQTNTYDNTEERQLALLSNDRISAASGTGNDVPGFLVTIKDDRSLWGCGLWLPKDDVSRPGYCTLEGTQAPIKLADDVVFAACAPGTYMASGAYYYITSNGDLYSAGSDENGRLGQDIVDIYGKYFSPKVILKNVKFANASGSNTIAITQKDELYVWGSNFNYFIPNSIEEFYMTPQKVMDGAIYAVPSEYEILVVKKDGSLWAWGLEPFDESGSAVNRKKEPYKIMDNVKKVYADRTGTFAIIKNDGSLWMWGDNYYGQVGAGYQYGSDGSDSVKKPVKVLSDVKEVALATHTVALKNDGTAYVWGENTLKQCGTASGKYILKPVKIAGGVTDIAATDGESYFLKTDGSIWGCGFNLRRYAFNGKGQEYQAQLINTGFGVK